MNPTPVLLMATVQRPIKTALTAHQVTHFYTAQIMLPKLEFFKVKPLYGVNTKSSKTWITSFNA